MTKKQVFTQHFNIKQTPQNQPIPGSSQIANSAGGFAWQVDDWARLHRFLILGSEGGTYYISEKQLTVENAQAVVRCIAADGKRTVGTIVEISDSGRAPKNDPAIFALALAASLGDAETKRAAFAALPKVCRIGTHLFHFAAYIETMRGWGRGLRNAVARWYDERPARIWACRLPSISSAMTGAIVTCSALLTLSLPLSSTTPSITGWSRVAGIGSATKLIPTLLCACCGRSSEPSGRPQRGRSPC